MPTFITCYALVQQTQQICISALLFQKRNMHLTQSKIIYVLTFAGLSIRAKIVASTAAASSGLVAATQKTDMGASAWLSI